MLGVLVRDDVDAVMTAARVLVAITAESVTAVEDVVTLPQFRVLVIVASRPGSNLAAVANGLRSHPSNATRAVDRLVSAGLLARQDDPADRRNLVIELTAEGRALVDQVMEQRRVAITAILDRMPRGRRRSLVQAMRAFAQAADDLSDDAAWSLGWTTP
jgi:DNA-binding MarR family transcriptional regulator